MPLTPVPGCELCQSDGGRMVWSDAHWRVVRVVETGDPAFPAFYRVIAQHHVAEFTDLGLPERERCMALVAGVEQVLRTRLRPTKVNLASLGNAVAHLHWHVIARFDWDSHFPQPVWGAPQRGADAVRMREVCDSLPALDTAVGTALAPGGAAQAD